ncbi:regulatory protein MerR [Acetohalobium arabaticum DSM 5501]|uniref:Regulatory protein MerR n=1 Tax=Acetohalobium arabaticum (strain ATCC 49924 / DSM 5501 / Z-7288) TaxID=574087 RepID=D9QPK1_ACEAZ|nr:helix-turn-helix domain-containing protein [Acetohalobium arabaticum]ADL12442.1 regulatory protein MerR [Acetohalobium arabaticum DSM 5501]
MKLSVKEAADFLGVAKSTLRRWDNEGKLVADRTEGGHRRYPYYSLFS